MLRAIYKGKNISQFTEVKVVQVHVHSINGIALANVRISDPMMTLFWRALGQDEENLFIRHFKVKRQDG